MISNTTQINKQQLELIDNIHKCIVQDELNHNTHRLPYTHKWVKIFLTSVSVRKQYSAVQAKILTELREAFISELKIIYNNGQTKL